MIEHLPFVDERSIRPSPKMTPVEQPKTATVVAPATWRSIDFLSDLHLQDAAGPTFLAFQQHMLSSRADAIFILGDLFEAWVGDDARSDPFESRCLEVLRQSSRTRFVGFMHGNRDFLVGDAFLNECGVKALSDPTTLLAFDQRLLLTHGDEWCLADTAYQKYRSQVRSPQWQAAILGQPLAERKALASKIRASSEAQRAMTEPDSWADVDLDTATEKLKAASTTTLIHGHTHRPSHDSLGANLSRWVLSDWDYESTPTRADVLRLTPAGFERIAPERG
jgi:UDP-2,3-diacylglucosamine hydrolase